MQGNYVFVGDLKKMIDDISEGTIISRTFHEDDHMKAILFGFAPEQELSEHTASMPATLYFLQGRAQLTLGEDTHSAEEGAFVHMAAHLPHSIRAVTPVLMLLIMNKAASKAPGA